MGIAAHDLRNPLGAVKGYVELMLEEEMERVEQVELLGKVREASSRMGQMVQNLLDANRIERGEMNLSVSAGDLVGLVRSVVEAHRPGAVAKQQSIEQAGEGGPVEVKMEVKMDGGVMMQVLENLVSNAVKYSPAGKRIEVGVERVEGAVRVRVKDEGPGLSEGDRRKLFGKFARLSAKPTGGESSTGLGLSIVKKMVEAMKGRVWCESEPGQGAAFIVELPAS